MKIVKPLDLVRVGGILHFAPCSGTLKETLNDREKLVQEKDSLLVQLGERAAALVKEKEGMDSALKAAAADAEATASKLRAVQSKLQKAEVRSRAV